MAAPIAIRVLKWSVIISVIVFFIHYWVSTKDYVFNDNDISQLATKYAGTYIILYNVILLIENNCVKSAIKGDSVNV